MLSKEEIEKENTFKISMPLITDEDIRKIDNNFENIVKEFTKSYVKEKDLVLAQYIMKKQQDKLDQLESDKQKLIENLAEENKQLEHDILTMSIDTGNKYSLKLIHQAEGMKKQNDRILEILKKE